MYHPVNVKYVKERALSRRDLLNVTAGAVAANVASTAISFRIIMAQPAISNLDLNLYVHL